MSDIAAAAAAAGRQLQDNIARVVQGEGSRRNTLQSAAARRRMATSEVDISDGFPIVRHGVCALSVQT